ncbi:cytochrome b/b6 domain-containing protein [Roseovarius sp. 217]|uniref:cytochrome b/b6 domain-containing protein n=1 Tax=Roseovarius sp. (strain 217) TaxID=314264 RepID=UPI0000685B6F|nr:cytochrome b/b6 domain-containing protein [Roseovarius sp. 217]EAQ27168.1 cytochrome, putative [Roseovarius sp. 217]
MQITNSATSYGSITKSFHWLTALLILSNLPLGWLATQVAHQIEATPTEDLIARATVLFSLHKTLGVAIFFVALARIVWAISQPKPGLLNGDRTIEAWAAETVHWLLYGSLVLVPLSGWVHHAATSGFAPIWWPLGQNLPLVPKSETLSETASTLHFVLMLVLAAAITAHVAGALKHHLLDGDATLRRMLPGRMDAIPTANQPNHALPLVAALAIWLGAVGGATWLGWFGAAETSSPATLAAVESDWQVESGQLQVTVQQLGSAVTGSFADWTANIAYSESPDDAGQHGTVEVTVGIASLSLGSVTQQAMGTDFFNTSEFPTARFAADLMATESGPVARGTLTIRDQSVPVEMPFDLTITGDTATAQGTLTLDRRNFNVGNGVKDEKSLGFGVDVSFDLTATRAN